MTEFLHELVKKQEWNAHLQELLDSDPWRYSEPPPPFTGTISTQTHEYRYAREQH